MTRKVPRREKSTSRRFIWTPRNAPRKHGCFALRGAAGDGEGEVSAKIGGSCPPLHEPTSSEHGLISPNKRRASTSRALHFFLPRLCSYFFNSSIFCSFLRSLSTDSYKLFANSLILIGFKVTVCQHYF